MGRYTKDQEISDDAKIGVQFKFNGADYKTIVEHLKESRDKDGKQIGLTKFLARVVSRIAADIRAGKRIKI